MAQAIVYPSLLVSSSRSSLVLQPRSAAGIPLQHATRRCQQRQAQRQALTSVFCFHLQTDAAADSAGPNAATVATKRALSALCEKGLLKFKWEDGNKDGRYQALPLGKAAFAAFFEPADAVAIRTELDRCAEHITQGGLLYQNRGIPAVARALMLM